MEEFKTFRFNRTTAVKPLAIFIAELTRQGIEYQVTYDDTYFFITITGY